MGYEATQRLQPQMAPTERLLWAGRPPRGVKLGKGEWPLLLIGAVLLGNGGFNAWLEWEAGEGLESFLHLVIPVIFVVLVLGRRILGDAYTRAHTFYGVSDQRVLILREKPSYRLTGFNLADLPDVALERTGMDGGEIRLTPDVVRQVSGPRSRRRRVRRRGVRLQLATGATGAFEIIRRAQRDATDV